MNKSKIKAFKVMTTAAVTSLLLSSFTVFAETNNSSTESQWVPIEFATSLTDETKDEAPLQSLLENQQIDQEKVAEDQAHKPYDQYAPTDTVRVIVEMTGEPVHSGKGNEAEKKKLKHAQQSLIREMKKTKKLNVKERHHFVTGINGFSMDTQFENIKDIEKLDGVARVHIAQTYQQTMSSSQSLVQAKKVWEELGYHGEGMVVAVVDTGVDYRHQDLNLSDKGKEKAKWTSATINEKLAETAVDERWYTDKVPTGYDWADQDQDVLPHATSHGMHVAGTIGANGNNEIDGVKGIAPDVQILAEKVFSDNWTGAYADDIIAGINHAVEMDADVINLSLGADANFVTEEDPIQKAVRTATEQGVLVVASAGNAFYSTKSGSVSYNHPAYAQNPDIGVVGTPGASPFALQVASYENDQVHMDTLTLSDGKPLIYQRHPGFVQLANVFAENQEIELVYVGYGRTQDYEGKDVTGKIVVVEQQWEGSEQSVQSPALQRGAKGVIMVPLATRGDYARLLFSPYGSVPGVSTGITEGNALIQRLKDGEQITARVGQGTYIDNKTKGTMSGFSSYGAPHTLDFKPEITAPGGKIYSTVIDNKYDVYNGTSMASPHVAGAGALVLQSLYEKGVNKDSNTVYQVKTALMNTAQIILDPATDKIPYSPRKQGAGMMQIANALKTPVLVKDKFAKPENAAAVELKEIKKNKVKFMLELEALAGKSSPDEITYDVYLDLLTDDTEQKELDIDKDGKNERTMEVLKLNSKRIEGAAAKINGKDFSDSTPATFTVKKGHLQDLVVDIKLPDGLKKNIFVEGFVRFVPKNGDQTSVPSLTIPYMGFYGDWDQPQNLDAPMWEQNAFLHETALFPYYGQKNWLGKPAIPLGYDKVTKTFSEERMANSPHAANQGVYSVFTTLRNVKQVHMYIEDASGNRVRDLGDFSEITGKPWKFRKNVMDRSEFFNGGYGWDLKSEDGKYVPDGKYQYIIESTLDYEGARPQTIKFPINIDSVAPKVENIQVNKTPENKYMISWDMMDNAGGSGLTKSMVYIDGIYKPISATQSSLLVNAEPKSVIVVPFDWAGNVTYEIYGDRSYVKQDLFLSAWDVWQRPITQQEPGHILGIGLKKLNWTITIQDPEGNVVHTYNEANTETAYIKWTPSADLPSGKYKVVAEMEDNETGLKITTTPRYMTVVKP
ncbi:S8 family serine peptidase [Cytobacillus dafuensis]|uniref:S8 family serine peptidase n=1 Tax=Cytobacillus dafuensis TaxID=1742359 RepID=A0A5B8Z537_CYTDA|nr:S8 family serine peptidase [Cytobacillus dafuensis]QED48018.1 S8 family serine peptidase [Cytobacillus dafuensis]